MKIYFIKPVDTDHGFKNRGDLLSGPTVQLQSFIDGGYAVEVSDISPTDLRKKRQKEQEADLPDRYYAEDAGGGGWYIIRNQDGKEIEKIRGKRHVQDQLKELNGD